MLLQYLHKTPTIQKIDNISNSQTSTEFLLPAWTIPWLPKDYLEELIFCLQYVPMAFTILFAAILLKPGMTFLVLYMVLMKSFKSDGYIFVH